MGNCHIHRRNKKETVPNYIDVSPGNPLATRKNETLYVVRFGTPSLRSGQLHWPSVWTAGDRWTSFPARSRRHDTPISSCTVPSCTIKLHCSHQLEGIPQQGRSEKSALPRIRSTHGGDYINPTCRERDSCLRVRIENHSS